VLHQLLAATSPIIKPAQALGYGVGMGLCSLGAGSGIGTVFASMIQSVARQPELPGELQGIMWLGCALTEAVVYYGLVGGFLGFVLVK
jgi:F-type H+-transporting ATPase subunit c